MKFTELFDDMVTKGIHIKRKSWGESHIYVEGDFHTLLGQGGIRHKRVYGAVIVKYTHRSGDMIPNHHQPGYTPSTEDLFAEDWEKI